MRARQFGITADVMTRTSHASAGYWDIVQDALADLQLVLPTVQLFTSAGWHGPFLSSTGSWSDEGCWMSAQPYGLPIDCVGRRFREPLGFPEEIQQRRMVQKHIHYICQDLRVDLLRTHDNRICMKMLERNRHDQFAKSAIVWARSCRPGPPSRRSRRRTRDRSPIGADEPRS